MRVERRLSWLGFYNSLREPDGRGGEEEEVGGSAQLSLAIGSSASAEESPGSAARVTVVYCRSIIRALPWRVSTNGKA